MPYCAQSTWVDNEPFAGLLADDLMTGQAVLAQLTVHFKLLQQSMLAVQEVPWNQTRRNGIVAGAKFDGESGSRLIKVSAMVEEPAPEAAPSRMAMAERYISTPAFFKYIRSQKPNVCSEL